MQSFSSLVRQFEEKILQPDLFPSQPANLYDPCRYLLSLGGKRIRPVVCLMANELFGNIREDAWHAAVAIELFHNFTLIHDDIMDKAPLRRGFPTIHSRYGLSSGILGGDAMSIYAYQSLTRIRTNLHQVLNTFNKTAIEVCEGQQLDMDFEQQEEVSPEAYILMISLKTSVLLAASLKIGALIAEADTLQSEQLYDFGKNLGIAFQLQDDYLDAFGSEEKLGKQRGGDILANKKTYLYIRALQAAGPEQKKEILALKNHSDNTDKVNRMLEIFQATGADRQCRQAVTHYSELSYQNLDALNVSEEKKIYLRNLAEQLLNRDR